jgi:hypothetical protein
MRNVVKNELRECFEKATKEQPWHNSLGMKFVPVAGTQVLFNVQHLGYAPGGLSCIRRERRLHATEGMYSIGKGGRKWRCATWKEPGFKQGPTNPVAGVSHKGGKAK